MFLFSGRIDLLTCISLLPYSKSYNWLITGGGNLPFFLIKIFGIDNLSERAEPKIKPLASIEAK